MLQKYSRYRILQEFFDSPTKDFQMRDISRRTKIAQPSVMNHLKALANESLIIREKKGIYPAFKANREDETFKVLKRVDLHLRMCQSGIIDHIYDSCTPDAIILFGSSSRGEDTEKSDIDLFVQAPEKRLSLEKYEKIMHRKINLFFGEDFSKLSNELKNNVTNGIVLKGYLKVF